MPTTATTQIYRDRLVLLSQPGGQVWLYMVKTMAEVDTRAKHYLSGVMVGVDTGNLRSNQGPPTVLQVGGNVLGVLENTAAYSFWVHEGTKPHEIRPLHKKWLYFEPSAANYAAGSGGGRTGTGQFVFAKAVQHPGTEPRPFLRRALEDVLAGRL